MKILVTGATGLLGSTITKQLHSLGHTVSVLYRPSSDRSLLEKIAPDLEWIEGDIMDTVGLEAAFASVDMVVHTAAMVSFIPKEKRRMHSVNVEGTANVVNASLHTGIKKLCHISSVAALGRPEVLKNTSPAPVEINEGQRWADSSSNSTYAVTKHHAELEVWRGIAEGLNAVILNPSVILGEGDWHKSSTRLFKYIYDEKPFYTDGLLNYVDVADVSEAACRLLLSDISGERFIVSGGTVPYRKFFSDAAAAMEKRAPKWKVNPFFAGLIWRFEAIRTLLTGSAPLLTKETARAAQHHFRFNGQKLSSRTGILYRNLDETLGRIGKSLKAAV